MRKATRYGSGKHNVNETDHATVNRSVNQHGCQGATLTLAYKADGVEVSPR